MTEFQMRTSPLGCVKAIVTRIVIVNLDLYGKWNMLNQFEDIFLY